MGSHGLLVCYVVPITLATITIASMYSSILQPLKCISDIISLASQCIYDKGWPHNYVIQCFRSQCTRVGIQICDHNPNIRFMPYTNILYRAPCDYCQEVYHYAHTFPMHIYIFYNIYILRRQPLKYSYTGWLGTATTHCIIAYIHVYTEEGMHIYIHSCHAIYIQAKQAFTCVSIIQYIYIEPTQPSYKHMCRGHPDIRTATSLLSQGCIHYCIHINLHPACLKVKYLWRHLNEYMKLVL